MWTFSSPFSPIARVIGVFIVPGVVGESRRSRSLKRVGLDGGRIYREDAPVIIVSLCLLPPPLSPNLQLLSRNLLSGVLLALLVGRGIFLPLKRINPKWALPRSGDRPSPKGFNLGSVGSRGVALKVAPDVGVRCRIATQTSRIPLGRHLPPSSLLFP